MKPIVDLKAIVAQWKSSLCPRIELAALISRNGTAHKWKATYRTIVLRELVCWRLVELMEELALLSRERPTLGSVILLRSAFETLSILIYINQKIESVLRDETSFFDFCSTTSRLMLGSKNKTTEYAAINIISVLELCEKKYPGILALYGDLSESAHPNYDGVCSGFSRIDEANFTTEFEDRWSEKYLTRLQAGIDLCVEVFQSEYNDVWPSNFEALERWLVDKDKWLEENKPSARRAQ